MQLCRVHTRRVMCSTTQTLARGRPTAQLCLDACSARVVPICSVRAPSIKGADAWAWPPQPSRTFSQALNTACGTVTMQGLWPPL